MMNFNNTHKIVRVYYDNNAPTGEGKYYVTEDGTHWRQTFGSQPPAATGKRTGRIIDDKIHERTDSRN